VTPKRKLLERFHWSWLLLSQESFKNYFEG